MSIPFPVAPQCHLFNVLVFQLIVRPLFATPSSQWSIYCLSHGYVSSLFLFCFGYTFDYLCHSGSVPNGVCLHVLQLVRRIKDRCRIENGKITCTFGRRKRAVEDEPAFGDGIDGGSSVDCDSHLENGGVPMMPFIDTFESVDQNDGGF